MDEPFSGLDPVNAASCGPPSSRCGRGARRSSSRPTRWRRSRRCASRSSSSTAAASWSAAHSVTSSEPPAGRSSGSPLDGDGRADGPDRLGWLDAFPGVRVTRPGADYVELTVPREVDPQTILHAVLERGDRVARFEIADPSLEEIFIERVGIRPGDDDELAPAVAPAAPAPAASL